MNDAEKKPDDELRKIKVKLDFAEQVMPLTGQSAFASNVPSPNIGEPPTTLVYAAEDTFGYRTLRDDSSEKTGIEITLQNLNENAHFLQAYSDVDGGVPAEVQDVLNRLVKLGGTPKEADFEFVVEDE